MCGYLGLLIQAKKILQGDWSQICHAWDEPFESSLPRWDLTFAIQMNEQHQLVLGPAVAAPDI